MKANEGNDDKHGALKVGAGISIGAIGTKAAADAVKVNLSPKPAEHVSTNAVDHGAAISAADTADNSHSVFGAIISLVF